MKKGLLFIVFILFANTVMAQVSIQEKTLAALTVEFMALKKK